MKPGYRGFKGRHGGRSTFLQAPPMWSGSTRQLCGIYPFSVGANAPMTGVPFGRHLFTGASVCCDPISYYQRARKTSNPSGFLLGLPGYGKSAAAKRMLIGLAAYGVTPYVLGDLKGEYLPLIRALGGQVITLGRGRGHLNVLDISRAVHAAARLREAGHGDEADRLLADARGRRHTLLLALLTVVRSGPPSESEDAILAELLRLLDLRQGVPVVADLVETITARPESLSEVAMDRGDAGRYGDAVEPLVRTLNGLRGSGRLGDVFAQHTTVGMERDRPVVFDVSSIDDSDTALQAGVLLACWSEGFGAVEIQNALSDAGLEPQRNSFLVLDELWRILRGSKGLIERVDGLTRLNRQRGVGQLMVTHTLSDLDALPDEEDRQKARGFVERAGLVICGALPDVEMEKVARIVRLTQAEKDTIVGWQNPPSWDSEAGVPNAPPGQGCFLIKAGGRPGVPVRVQLTRAELALTNTDQRWSDS